MSDHFTGMDVGPNGVRFMIDGHVEIEMGGEDLQSWACRQSALRQVSAMYGVPFDMPRNYIGPNGGLFEAGRIDLDE